MELAFLPIACLTSSMEEVTEQSLDHKIWICVEKENLNHEMKITSTMHQNSSEIQVTICSLNWYVMHDSNIA